MVTSVATLWMPHYHDGVPYMATFQYFHGNLSFSCYRNIILDKSAYQIMDWDDCVLLLYVYSYVLYSVLLCQTKIA